VQKRLSRQSASRLADREYSVETPKQVLTVGDAAKNLPDEDHREVVSDGDEPPAQGVRRQGQAHGVDPAQPLHAQGRQRLPHRHHHHEHTRCNTHSPDSPQTSEKHYHVELTRTDDANSPNQAVCHSVTGTGLPSISSCGMRIEE